MAETTPQGQGNTERLSSSHGNAPSVLHSFLLPVAFPFSLPTEIYGAMLAIWHIRPAMQKRFPIHKGKSNDFVRLLAWCAGDGRRLYAILRSLPEWEAMLSQRIQLPEVSNDFWEGGFSVDMFLHGVSMCRYSLGPILHEARIRNLVAIDYWRGARHKRFQPSPSRWQCDFMKERFGEIDKLLDTLQDGKRKAGVEDFRLVQEFGLAEILHVFNHEGRAAKNSGRNSMGSNEVIVLSADIHGYSLGLPVKLIRADAWLREQFYERPTESQLSSITERISIETYPLPKVTYPFGVNLFGYANGELGIGEDVRSVAQALQSQNIPFCIVNVQLGSNISQLDNSVEEWVVSEPRFAINIFCTTGIEQVRYACVHGLDVLRGRYNIGLWPWELPEWPASCTYAYALVDEIWGISSFAAKSFRKAGLPVQAMTLPVTLGEIADVGRSFFGLPENDYLFVFSFDLNSKLSRKNPEGVIRAFQQAFSVKSAAQVGLVIKVSHVSGKNKQWNNLKSIIKKDCRIHVIDTTLRRPQVLALYRCCDCFVSLHRAEGFGRALAEALLLDKQLVATSYSGNMDFCDSDRVWLVKYKIRKLQSGEYFHGDNQQWAEPDIGHAAELMREIWAKPKKVRSMEFDFSPAKVGERYAQRLSEIEQQLNLS